MFDVLTPAGEFMHYDEYSAILETYGVRFIPCTLKSRNPTYEILLKATENNRYLLQENSGVGEGIVIKQYGWKNRFQRTTWAKLITNTFKDKHIETMGGSVVNAKLVEEEIVDEFMTVHMVEKIVAKIRNDQGQFGARNIPQFLGQAYHDLVTEELWQAVKKHKQPKVDFKTLNHCAIRRVKALMPELFGVAIAQSA
ncbi:MAG: RNA ligase family protein [Burkholderiales bacterium]